MRIILILGVFFLGSCHKIPSDPNKSFEKAKENGLAVGFTVNPPWIFENNGMADGVEAQIIKGFARSNNMKIEWETGSEQELLKKLEEKKLHAVLAGLTSDTPWKSRKIGLTRPYYKIKKANRVIAIQQGENRMLFSVESYFLKNKDSIADKINKAKE
jgi:polar amino acid transport system substrate-binding protein